MRETIGRFPTRAGNAVAVPYHVTVRDELRLSPIWKSRDGARQRCYLSSSLSLAAGCGTDQKTKIPDGALVRVASTGGLAHHGFRIASDCRKLLS
jgi:hypothetical protein